MNIISLFKPNPVGESACLCSKLFRNDSLQKIAIIHHENSRKRLIYPYFVQRIFPRLPTRFLKSNMKTILLSKLNPMVESACLFSKPFRNDSLQKMAIIPHENSRKRSIYHYFVQSISPRFLPRFLKILVQIIVLSKPDLMVVSACLWSKLLRNDRLQKMAIIHRENLKLGNFASYAFRLLHFFSIKL